MVIPRVLTMELIIFPHPLDARPRYLCMLVGEEKTDTWRKDVTDRDSCAPSRPP
jgi:hypothetical protein